MLGCTSIPASTPSSRHGIGWPASSPRTEVQLRFEADSLLLAVTDSGVGFDPAAPRPTPTLGMSSMRERAEGVCGRLVVESAPGQGTRVSAELPIPHAA